MACVADGRAGKASQNKFVLNQTKHTEVNESLICGLWSCYSMVFMSPERESAQNMNTFFAQFGWCPEISCWTWVRVADCIQKHCVWRIQEQGEAGFSIAWRCSKSVVASYPLLMKYMVPIEDPSTWMKQALFSALVMWHPDFLSAWCSSHRNASNCAMDKPPHMDKGKQKYAICCWLQMLMGLKTPPFVIGGIQASSIPEDVQCSSAQLRFYSVTKKHGWWLIFTKWLHSGMKNCEIDYTSSCSRIISVQFDPGYLTNICVELQTRILQPCQPQWFWDFVACRRHFCSRFISCAIDHYTWHHPCPHLWSDHLEAMHLLLLHGVRWTQQRSQNYCWQKLVS